MRPGPFVALYAAIAAFTGVAALMQCASELDYRLPNGDPPDIETLAPRCYFLWPRVRDFSGSTPVSIRLTQTFVADFGALGRWYRVEFLRGKPRGHELWRPAGSDSLDITLSEAFKGFRLRIPSTPIESRGRVVGAYDFGIAWAGTVTSVRFSCAELTGHP